MNYRKICLVLFLGLFLSSVALSGFAFAQKELEIKYPTVPGAETPTTVKSLPSYINYIFNLSLLIAGLVVFASLLYGGLKYLTSAGSPSAMGDAKDRIFSSLLGLVIILSSYLILTTVNPQLIILKEPGKPIVAAPDIPGVYLCKSAELSTKNCVGYVSNSDSIDKAFSDKIEYIRFINNPPKIGSPPEVIYGAVLHENNGREGTCKTFLSGGPVKLPAGYVSSITVFKQGGGGGTGTTVYRDKDYAGGYYDFNVGDYPKTEIYKYIDCKPPGVIRVPGKDYCALENTITSLDVRNGFMVILFGDADYGGRCEVFTQKDPDLSNNSIGHGQVSALQVLPIK